MALGKEDSCPEFQSCREDVTLTPQRPSRSRVSLCGLVCPFLSFTQMEPYNTNSVPGCFCSTAHLAGVLCFRVQQFCPSLYATPFGNPCCWSSGWL